MKCPSLLTKLLILTAAIAGQIVLTYFLYKRFQHIEDDRINSDIDILSQRIIDNIDDFQKQITLTLHHVAELFRILGVKYIEPSQFESFTHLRGIAQQSTRWIPRILHEERHEYETWGKQYYGTNFTIKDLTLDLTTFEFELLVATNRSEYYPFTHNNPFTSNLSIGIDLATTEIIVPLLLDILDINSTSVTSKIPLSMGTSDKNFSVYANLVLRNNSEIIGLSQTIISPYTVVLTATALTGISHADVDFAIFDLNNKEDPVIFSDDNYDAADELGQFDRELTAKFFDHTYRYVFRYKSKYIDSQRTDESLILLIMLVIIFLILDIVVIVADTQQKLLRQSREYYKHMLNYVNHELRNPLHIIMAHIEFVIDNLQKSTNDIPQYEPVISDLYTIKGHTFLMNQIISDVLTLKGIEEGNISIKQSTINIQDVIYQVHKSVGSKIRENPDVEFLVDCPEEFSFVSDNHRIMQALINLLDNATKFTISGHVRLTVKKEENNMIRFEVQDTGIGVEPSKVKLLFTKYSQMAPELSRTGIGLGLYISKAIVRLLGGEMGYKPNPAGGSIFWFTINSSHTVRDELHIESIV
jgi:signal transduction histidine kinase